jgi:tRNA-Thr(GGU) m(6)t(6)A37 methyltransferase TsaA
LNSRIIEDVKMRKSGIVIGVVAALCATLILTGAKEVDEVKGKEFTLRAVGTVRKADGRTMLVMNKDVEPALLGLDGFSHVLVFWWFDKNDTPEKRGVLQVHPRGNMDNPITGVFACRCPMRPNLLALTNCKIVSVKDNVVEIEDIDAFDGTPILDLKGYIPGYDSVENATAPGWRFKEK